MPVSVLIAEDDPEMRRVLKKIAEEEGALQVVGEAADGAAAVKLFETLRPQVVFIDVDLPAKNGVTVAREIFHRDPRARLVFITAYDQFRAEAFEVYACDYLVKPFRVERLRQTIERLCLELCGEKTASQPPSRQRASAGRQAEDLHLFRAGSRLILLHLGEIVFITKEGRRTVVYHTGGRVEITEKLNSLAKELGYPFLRTHKGFIVNVNMIREITPASRTYELVLDHTEKRALMTPKMFRELEKFLEAKSPARSSKPE
ncbi:MAG: LytTR family DNA-binding domain-containing protein [Bacillota bacterium]